MLKLSFFLFFLAVLPGAGQQGIPHPTAAQFDAGLRNVKTNYEQWRKTLHSVKIDDLPVSYQVGKILEKQQDIVNNDIVMVSLWADKAAREHSVFAEINFLSSIQDLQNQVGNLVALLDEFNVTDSSNQKQVEQWKDAMSAIANGQMNDVFVTTLSYVSDRARQIDQSCAMLAPAPRSSTN